MKILVTGGAGYIGSFMTKRLLDDGHSVTVVDSLFRGHKSGLDTRAELLEGDLLDKNFVSRVFDHQMYDGIIHFAGLIAVGESMQKPGWYFENNVQGTINLLEGMVASQTKNIIFSSTATVYGNPDSVPISESAPNRIGNPYGESKLIVEHILRWYNEIHKTNYAVLRYFNASGAALDGSMGEDHDPETHLIPNAIKAALNGTDFSLFGDDYDTKDGTGVRDYIHVYDLVEAHVLALQKLQKDGGMYIYNVGTGHGYSNREVLDMVKKVTGKEFAIIVKERRAGDAPATIADATKIQNELGFKTKYSDLETIIKSAYLWHSTHPSGYNG